MRQLILSTLAMCLIAFTLAGCSKKTEEQRLDDFRGSLKYKAYRLASDKSVALAVREYNKQASSPVDEQLVHSTLGIIWFVSNNYDCALIEADMLAKSDAAAFRNTSLGLKSVALAKMECPRLSQQHYGQLKEALAAERNLDANTIEVEHKLALLSLIAVSLYHGDPELGTFAADALGSISQLDYLPPLVAACVKAKQGHPLDAVAQLRKVAKSDGFAEHKQFLCNEVADIIANSPDSEKLGEELTQRVLVTIVQRVLDDIFTAENRQALLKMTRELPDKLPGKS